MVVRQCPCRACRPHFASPPRHSSLGEHRTIVWVGGGCGCTLFKVPCAGGFCQRMRARRGEKLLGKNVWGECQRRPKTLAYPAIDGPPQQLVTMDDSQAPIGRLKSVPHTFVNCPYSWALERSIWPECRRSLKLSEQQAETRI